MSARHVTTTSSERNQRSTCGTAGLLERALIFYARNWPLSRGKIRVVNTFWRLFARGNPLRTARLVYGNLKMPCDLRGLLQRQFYFFGTYYLERDILDSWANLAADARVIFDLGANAGIYSLVATAAAPFAKIYAFEPTPEIADRLRATITLNQLSNINVEEIAISYCDGEAYLIRCGGGEDNQNDGMNYISTDEKASLVNRVCTRSLDSFCSESGIERIDLMKMDIQGAEALALRGAARLLEEGRIECILFELNWDDSSDECPAKAAVHILERAGYCFSAPGATRHWRAAGAWMRPLTDVLAMKIRQTV